jgi:AbrB family looped-hinge helix DNA binding protein
MRGASDLAAARAFTVARYPPNVTAMPLAKSRLNARGQISVPTEVRKRLGVGPGSILEWDEKNEEIIVRRAGRYISADVHEALFPDGSPERKESASVKEGIRQHIRRRHARG